jgi:uncharacterized membrane protein YphA (DoxX/SURF4 family)
MKEPESMTTETRSGGYHVQRVVAPAWSSSAFHKILFFGLRPGMGAVFLYASYDKLLHPRAFAEAIYNYQILPDAAVNLAALILPWLELLLGACLVAGVWLPGATVAGTGLLTIFMAALIFNLARGLDIHCGCFSTEPTDEPAGLWTVARDMTLLAASILLTTLVLRRPKVERESASLQKAKKDENRSNSV